MDSPDLFTVNDLAVTCKSKIELYNVLTREGDIYLPPKQDATQKYLRDVLLANKLYVKCSKVIVTKVPQYSGLRVKDIIKFAETEVDIHRFLPKYEYNKEPNREWLCNLVNTLIPEKFNQFIQIKIKKRNKELIASQNLGISIKPEFIQIFKNSQAISTMNGKSHYLARTPKKTKVQLKIIKYEEQKEETNRNTEMILEELQSLKTKIKDFELRQDDADQNSDKLARLYDLGLIDANGDPINSEMKQ